MASRHKTYWRSIRILLFLFLTCLVFFGSVCYSQNILFQLEQNLQDQFATLGPSVVEISIDLSSERATYYPVNSTISGLTSENSCPGPSAGGLKTVINSNEKRMGTGVVFDHEHRIVTAEALLRGITPDSFYTIEVQTFVGEFFHASIVGMDPISGVAVLEPVHEAGIEPVLESLRPITFGDSETIRTGALLLMASSCYGMNNSAFWGMVSGKQQWLDCYLMHDYIQTTFPLQPGAVGAPVCNLKGEVIGLMAASFRQAPWQEISFAIPCNRFKDVLPVLIRDGCVHRGYLGICIADLTPEIRQELGISEDINGIVVDRVLEGSPAQASMQSGDVIMSIGTKEVSSIHEVLWIVANMKPNTRVEIALIRDGKPESAEVVLGDSCSNKFTE